MSANGLCECGCGEKTASTRGRPNRFIRGHQCRLTTPEYVIEDRGYKTSCWIWQRSLTRKGYGHRAAGGGKRRAHVVAWEKVNGPVPQGLQLDHLCRVRACVNPDHLEPVTNAENSRRGANTKLTPGDVVCIRQELAAGRTHRLIAGDFGVSSHTVAAISQRRLWA